MDNPNNQPFAMDSCRQIVASQSTGLAFVKADKIFREKFPGAVVNQPTALTLTFSDGQTLQIPPIFFEALKKDCGTIKEITDEMTLNYISLPGCTYDQFSTLLNFLYGSEAHTLVQYLNQKSDDLLPVANYLNTRNLDNLINNLKSEIDNFKTNNKDDLNRALEIHQKLTKLMDNPQIKDIIRNKLATYLGNVLLEAKPEERDDLIVLYKKASVNALSFVRSNKVDNVFLTKLSALDKLKALDLTGCYGITNEGLKNLPKNLNHLILNQLNVNNNGLQFLPKTLISLDLFNCNQITDVGLKNLPRGLERLNLSTTKITDSGLVLLPPNLKKLDLSYCNNITNNGIKALPRKLQSLDIRGCRKITDEGLKNLPPEMTHLSLENPEITNEGLNLLPSTLRSLYLGFSDHIYLIQLYRLGQNIISLSLSDYPHMSDLFLTFLPTNLKELTLRHCGEVPPESLNKIPQIKVMIE